MKIRVYLPRHRRRARGSAVGPKRRGKQIRLRFQDGPFEDPFPARHVSDGAIKRFACRVRRCDPKVHPLLGVEEPEKHLIRRRRGAA